MSAAAIAKRTVRARGSVACALALALLTLPAGLAAPARAQAVSNNFAAFSQNRNEPIDIESDTLEVHDSKKLAIFKGNVKAVQGKMVLRSRELHVKYTGDGTTQGKGTQITEINATGPVIITTKDNQTTTSDWARFDVKDQKVVIGGNVVLSQGQNVIKGDRLVIDLKTGESRFENEGDVTTRKRVRGLFMPKSKKKPEAATPGAKAPEAAKVEKKAPGG